MLPGGAAKPVVLGVQVAPSGTRGMGNPRHSRGGPGHGTLGWTRASTQAGKALRSQGHHHARVM